MVKKLLNKPYLSRSDYLQYSQFMAQVMQHILMGMQPPASYNQLFAKIKPNLRLCILQYWHLDEQFREKSPHLVCQLNSCGECYLHEMTRLYLIFYTRQTFQHLKQLMEYGMIKLDQLPEEAYFSSNLSKLNSKIDQQKRLIDQGLGTPDVWAELMQSVIKILQMGKIPTPHYDNYFAKMSDQELSSFLIWLLRQKKKATTVLQKERVTAILLYLYFFCNTPERFYWLHFFWLL